MKRLVVLGLLAACGGGYTGEGGGDGGGGGSDFAIAYRVVSGGSALELSWERVQADTYRVYADGELVASVTDTAYTLTVPCGLVEVEAYPSGLWARLDIAEKVIVSRVSDWGEMDSPYNPALGFEEGVARTYPEADAAHYGNFEALLDDGYSGVYLYELDLRGPTSYSLPYNSHKNGFAPWGSGIVAPDTSQYREVYPDQGGLTPGSYALWLNPEGLGWDTLDHFVKLVVESVETDGKVVATLYYQSIGGLRWIPEP